MDSAGAKKLVDRYIAAYNAFDIDGMLVLLSPDIRFENHSGDQPATATTGIDEFRQLAQQSKTLFSEREQRVAALRIGQDSAIADIAFRGVLAADVPGGPAAGTVLELQGTSEFTFDDGRIARIVDRS
ncbi:nuclear transport factor 2 family protein [Flavobacterium sp. MXW15]|uniref:Nuclear transport factor 2 family protein n=1 Tax=Xanthomonas chitinilytica TaxID=2989819 RepID=A0ABT3JRZ2_9XANT|nr:nuclear transport factor 2 family protein [Xanthomonas sp. H13-6]MCW4453691.1 nuclear transport factor 2 family protein [Flavobacterium sp. MXW15]MCW4471258.1 nuclear transport factor 2 family protein [Xanthomonas sp. H13-6]